MYSQAEEDDVLAELIDRLDLAARTPCTFVEIGVGIGTENNTRLLADRGWRGWWVGDEPLRIDAPATVSFEQATVTPENVADLLRYVPAPVTVFSLDIDGNDYWVGRVAIVAVRPAIVIVEYAADRHGYWVMPYTPGYRWSQGMPCGASLGAWQQLLDRDYVLVYTTRAHVNAVFVRRSVLAGQPEEGLVEDSLQAIITELQQLQADLAQNEGRPSVHELQNRLGRLAILAEMVQQNLQIVADAKTPPPPTEPPPPPGGSSQSWTSMGRDYGTPSDAQVLDEATGSDALPADPSEA